VIQTNFEMLILIIKKNTSHTAQLVGDSIGRFSSSFLVSSNSQHIGHLSSTIFDTLIPSITSYSYPDQIINLHDLGIDGIESNTFVNYPKSVTTIILSSNSLSYLPYNLFQRFSRTLINLNLQQNQFNSLTNNYFLRYLEQLRILDLSKNQINELFKQDFLGLKRLDTLILRNNHLTYLSYSTFIHCRKITTLDLSDNKISLLDSNTFYLLNNLKVLLLSNNPLGQRSLTNHLLKPLKNLEYLDLENTQLENLSAYLFISNHRLKSIKLRQNHFQTNLTRTFCGTRSLMEIDLVSTNIQSLDICTYHQISSLRRLYLMNNPLDCTCDLFYLKYGDVYRAIDGNGIDQTYKNIDLYLNRWISRPELRRQLEKAHARGDFSHLPIELSLFARCATPTQWNGYEIDNITGIYNQCRQRWVVIEQECRNYCQVKNFMEISLTITNSVSSEFRHDDFYLIGLVIFIYNR
jgi:hypothetical protein